MAAPSSARTQKLLSGPVLPTLASLAAPGLVLAIMQTSVSIADTHFVGRLGTDALAGLALVFPLVMLLQMTSAGAMGGGVSSAIARALGAGNAAGARRLVPRPSVNSSDRISSFRKLKPWPPRRWLRRLRDSTSIS